MKYTTPKLHSFGQDVKHGGCGPGSSAEAECTCGSSDFEDQTCNTGGGAGSCSQGDKPAGGHSSSSCSKGNVAKTQCNTGMGFSPTYD